MSGGHRLYRRACFVRHCTHMERERGLIATSAREAHELLKAEPFRCPEHGAVGFFVASRYRDGDLDAQPDADGPVGATSHRANS